MNRLATQRFPNALGGRILALSWLLMIGGASSMGADRPVTAGTRVPAKSEDSVIVGTLVTSEETDLALRVKMVALSEGLLNLRLPGPDRTALFAPAVVVRDLAESSGVGDLSGGKIATNAWPIAPGEKSVTQPNLWRPLLDSIAWFEHAKVHLIRGEHPGGDPYRYDSKVGFEAMARMKTGEWRSFHGKVDVVWQRPKVNPGDPVSDWSIATWATEALHWVASPRQLFVESLDQSIRPIQDVERLRRSPHYQATLKYYRSGMKAPPHPYFAPISANQKEGLAVADVDGDGFDDVYITLRIGKNLFLHNNGDGTFTEDGAARGLDLPGHTTCALFADFDNDGDLDLILGRSLLKTTYLENRDGKFIQLPIPPFMPMAAISMAAADYNGDGLLDVYICTYRPAAPPGASPAGGVAQVKDGDFDWPDEFFPPDLAKEYRRRMAEHRQKIGGTVLDQLGPPNVLLVNRGGGKFEVAPENPVVGVWRNSLQATWGDYDQDGDPDLYIANDWGPDNLFRNDGSAGFKDVTAEAGVQRYGFAMGASWGDYDNDGLEDVYVSNMYSAAGMRMTTRIPGIDPMFVESAQGNWLYKQSPKGKFTQVAGMAPPAMTVMNAGWSWGGCFTDFNNDGFLDLYVLSGYFTAPKELTSGLDVESNLWRTMVRTDEKLARPSFRFAPEWKKTGAPDNLGPQIDARLAGFERQGDKVLVHSLNGDERNHYFANDGGRSFSDLSALSGLDNPADSRGFAVLDYDRDGWQEIALVNANQPLFNLYHNEMGAAGNRNGMIALKFVGGNKGSSPAKGLAPRDGYGAKVTLEVGDMKLIREHRCGDGWATQNSPTMIVGMGSQTKVSKVQVRWPSGKVTTLMDVPEGTLLTAYETASDGPNGEAFAKAVYRVKPTTAPVTAARREVFPVFTADSRAKPGARLRVYTSFATQSTACLRALPLQQLLKEQLASQGVDVIAVTVDPDDDNEKLGAFNREWHPVARLVNVAQAQRKTAAAFFAKALEGEQPTPCSVVTDDTGHILAAQAGIPTLSQLRKLLAKTP